MTDTGELVARAAELVAGSEGVSAEDVVDRALRRLAGRATAGDRREAALREVELVAENALVHAALAAGDFERAFARLRPHLVRWATVLVKGLAAPRPEPDDLVQDAFVKLERAPMFRTVEMPLGYAHRVVKNLVCDHARARAREIVRTIDERDLPAAALEHSHARVDAIIAKAALDPQESCMLLRVVFERLAVPAAQRECGGPAGDPYYVLDKIFDKIAAALGLDRSNQEGR